MVKSGSLDAMLGKAAEFYEDEVDEAVKGLRALMLEPFIIVILGNPLIGGIVVSMYPADLQAGPGRLGATATLRRRLSARLFVLAPLRSVSPASAAS